MIAGSQIGFEHEGLLAAGTKNCLELGRMKNIIAEPSHLLMPASGLLMVNMRDGQHAVGQVQKPSVRDIRASVIVKTGSSSGRNTYSTVTRTMALPGPPAKLTFAALAQCRISST